MSEFERTSFQITSSTNEFLRTQAFEQAALLAHLSATVEANAKLLEESRNESRENAKHLASLEGSVEDLGRRVGEYRAQCKSEHDAIMTRLDTMTGVSVTETVEADAATGLVALLDAMTMGRMATLVGLCMLVALTVGGSCWVAQTGKLPAEFHHMGVEAETPTTAAVVPEMTDEERAAQKAAAREAVLELLQDLPVADAE